MRYDRRVDTTEGSLFSSPASNLRNALRSVNFGRSNRCDRVVLLWKTLKKVKLHVWNDRFIKFARLNWRLKALPDPT